MSSIDGIRKQEEDIFDELGSYDFSEPPKFAKGSPRDQALKQLAVSEDSPFSRVQDLLNANDLKRSEEERAALLRVETEEIKRQLEIVKRRLHELKPPFEQEDDKFAAPKDTHAQVTRMKKILNENDDPENFPGQTLRIKTPVNGNRLNESIKNTDSYRRTKSTTGTQTGTQQQPIKKRNVSEPKLRPLTGKADCPNCICDRRSSVCDQCINLALVILPAKLNQRQIKRAQLESSLPSSVLVAHSKPLSTNNSVETESRVSGGDRFVDNPDERPIRPAKEKVLGIVETIDDKVVPGKVYTISKSLNEKRTKLAQAIDDLQVMMDQVKEKGNRLEEERKLVQLYKDQWKFGPTIGGPVASPRQRLGALNQRLNYESRLDPNLNRDTKSLMGFQHIGSTMKLRQSNSNSNSNLTASTASSRMKARQSVHHLRSKSLETLAKTQQQQKSSLTRQSSQETGFRFQTGKSASEVNLSSSLASKSKPVSRGREKEVEAEEKSENGDDDDTVEEVNVEDIADKDSDETSEQSRAPSSVVRGETQANNIQATAVQLQDQQARTAVTVQKMTWIPVFGETEIKTVKRTLPKRKVQIVKSAHTNGNVITEANKRSQIQYQGRQLSSVGAGNRINNMRRAPISCQQQSSQRPRSGYISCQTSAKSLGSNENINDRVIVEAKRKLKFASNLLEQEHRDSANKNQLIINRTLMAPVPKTQSRTTSSSKAPSSRTLTSGDRSQPSSVTNDGAGGKRYEQQQQQQQQSALGSNPLASSDIQTLREISRLEEMLNEQQRLLTKLTQSQDTRQIVSPITVRCASPCCHHTNSSAGTFGRKSAASSAHQHHRQVAAATVTATAASLPSANKLLINTLRDRLNKTRMRLARTLEEERAKHQQLKKKVDSSLRKQSDLENENELLKQSLSKCIDTCLKDISNTFESLGDTLADSINIIGNQQNQQQVEGDADGAAGKQSSASPQIPDNRSPQVVLSNAAQLITDNRLLKQMENHIAAIEQQRRGIFQELGKEKQRSNQLELRLRQSQAELNRLMEAERRLESQATLEGEDKQLTTAQSQSQTNERERQQTTPTLRERQLVIDNVSGKGLVVNDDSPQPSTSSQQPTNSSNQLHSSQIESELDESYNSIDAYRRYIQSTVPDIEYIRRERKWILGEFDNIKKMLSNIDDS